MVWTIGGKIRILDSSKILGKSFNNGDIFEIIEVSKHNTPVININGRRFRFYETELDGLELLKQ